MTKTTDTRQLRLMISDLLNAHGIDNLALEMLLVDGVRTFFEETKHHDPVKVREQIINSLISGTQRATKLGELEDMIRQRVHINPTTREWQDFIAWAAKQKEPLSGFLTWWLSDEWNLLHPPARPDVWYVKWPLAFENVFPETPVYYE